MADTDAILSSSLEATIDSILMATVFVQLQLHLESGLLVGSGCSDVSGENAAVMYCLLGVYLELYQT